MRQPPRRVQGLLLLAAASLLTACPSLTTLHTARPIEPGRTQVAGAVGVYGFDDPQGGGHIGLLEGEIRYGFDERLDGGLRITGFSMYQADLNAALILSDDFVLSVDPTISTLPLGSFGITYLWLPVLADVINTEDLTLTLAFKTGKLFVASLDPSNRIGVQASGTLIGFGAGLKIRIWDRFALMPEFNIVSPRSSGVADDEIYTVSLGLIF